MVYGVITAKSVYKTYTHVFFIAFFTAELERHLHCYFCCDTAEPECTVC